MTRSPSEPLYQQVWSGLHIQRIQAYTELLLISTDLKEELQFISNFVHLMV